MSRLVVESPVVILGDRLGEQSGVNLVRLAMGGRRIPSANKGDRRTYAAVGHLLYGRG
jgi:hypothetical protein